MADVESRRGVDGPATVREPRGTVDAEDEGR